MIEYISFKPRLVSGLGVKLGRFDEIHYNGPLSKQERNAIAAVNRACKDANVELYCSLQRYDRFLDDIMTNAEYESQQLIKIISTLSQGEFCIDGTEIRPLKIPKQNRIK